MDSDWFDLNGYGTNQDAYHGINDVMVSEKYEALKDYRREMESREIDKDGVVVNAQYISIVVGLRSLRWACLVMSPCPFLTCGMTEQRYVLERDRLTCSSNMFFRREDCVFQLALAAVRNVIGLMMLGVDCGVEVDTDLFEEATTFNVLKDNSDLCQVNRVSFGFRPRGAFVGIYARLAVVRTREPLHGPEVINSFKIQMGKASCQFPIYADSFVEGSLVATDVDVFAVVIESSRWWRRFQRVAWLRQTNGQLARIGRRNFQMLKLGRKLQVLLARIRRRDSQTLISGRKLQIKELSENLRKSDNFGRAEKSRFRSSRDDAFRNAHSEWSHFKDEVAIYKGRINQLQKHIFNKRVADESLFMQCQAVGTRKVLKKLIKKCTTIPGETMCQLKVDKKKLLDLVDALEITDLRDDDLVAFPEFEDEAVMTTAEGEATSGGS
ncbi:hypothetical protein ISN44_As02g007910 [Arabidopsis suecica]|uniref:DUF1204 domain-containing protein n=1 Tax=Arabidopsis suecica TaxID=45249 RepID=A0A8T2G273_ARASU|nr:hypothetical protein ISN44_As02g007910 [Arabidopsis suecica]